MLLSFFEWCEATALGHAIRDSLWLFPAIQSVHLISLALLGGSVLLVDLRLLGFGLRHQPVAQLARDIEPWLIASLVTIVVTGIALFTSEALRCYYSEPFWWKMEFLAAAIPFTFTIRRKVTLADENRVGPIWGRLTAVVSLTLWFGVGLSGRWIAFY